MPFQSEYSPQPQIMGKMAQETLCAGIAARSQSFNTGPVLFWIALKKAGSMHNIMSMVIEPIIISNR
jgi:hypothetical protein